MTPRLPAVEEHPLLLPSPRLRTETASSAVRARRSRRLSEGLELQGLFLHPRAGQGRRSSMLRDSHAPALGLSLREVERPGTDLMVQLPARLRADTKEMRSQMVALAGSEDGSSLKVDRLGSHGFTTEDLSRVIYDKFKDTDLPEFVDYVELEKQGGLDRIGEIWCQQKYLWFAFLMGSVLFNLAYLVAMNWRIFHAFVSEMFERMNGLDMTDVKDAYSRLVETGSETADVFKVRDMDPQTRWLLLNIAALVATWEVCWVLVKLAHSCYIWTTFALGSSEYKSFHAIVYFFQKLLPQFSTFSALKLMAKVHPSLIYNEYLHFQNESALRATSSGQLFLLLYFALKCLFCALSAMGAFAIKLLAVSVKLTNPQCSYVSRFGAVMGLLLQCMGCVIIEIVLQDRLFLFVFGGQDAMYEDIEHAYKKVYEARVARQIWQDFWGKGRRLQALVLLATFDHYDLQHLLLEKIDDGSGSDFELHCRSSLSTINEEREGSLSSIGDVNELLATETEPMALVRGARRVSSRRASLEGGRASIASIAESEAGRVSRKGSDEAAASFERAGRPTPPPLDLLRASAAVGEMRLAAGEARSSIAEMRAAREAAGSSARENLFSERENTDQSGGSQHSGSSRGMRAVTRCLRNSNDWREELGA